jgi:DNA-binding FrmR family transcriptional regulator
MKKKSLNAVSLALIVGLIISYLILFWNTSTNSTKIKEKFETEDDTNSLHKFINIQSTLRKLAEKISVVSDKVDSIETFILNRQIDETVEEEYEQTIQEEDVNEEEYFNEFENDTLNSDESMYMNVYEEVNVEFLQEVGEEIFEEQNNYDIIEGFVDSASLNCHHL